MLFRPDAPLLGAVEGRRITASLIAVQRDGRIAGGAGMLSAAVVSVRPSMPPSG